MIKDIISDIKNNIEVRANLIKLKEELKNSDNIYACAYELGDGRGFFQKLLQDEDAKVRKNTAIIIGRMQNDEYVNMLFEAYEKEEQLFVKSSYLSAIGELNYIDILDKLKGRLEYLGTVAMDDDNRKHLTEEKKVLSELILAIDGIEAHEFTGYDKKSQIILITNRNYPDITIEQIHNISKEHGHSDTVAKTFNAGVMVTTSSLRDILPVRTYKELLFSLDDIKICDNEPIAAAKLIASSSLIKFLDDRHSGPKEYYFRVEYKGKLDLSQKSIFARKFAGELEHLSEGRLINSTSNYEVEIRLIENKSGKLNVLVKLYTIKDERFNYRTGSVAASIQPVNAALIMALAKDYMKENAKILDPFCGVGTMLIERHKFLRANTIYGIDIYGDAINKARKNTENAGVIAHYVNKDFFEFEHEYVFDEIITNMPRLTGHKQEKEIEDIFKRFFEKADEHLTEDGVIIMHCYEPELVRKYAAKQHRIVKEFEISKKEKSYLYVIK